MTTQTEPDVKAASGAASELPTVWGLTPVQIHDRFWAARGVQVVRLGQPSEIVKGSELYLLTDPRSLVDFKLRILLETLSWLSPRILMLRLRDSRERGFREQAVADDDGAFVRFQRVYDVNCSRLARVALTPHAEIARTWQNSPDTREGWRRIRRLLSPGAIAGRSVPGHVYDRAQNDELAAYTRFKVGSWVRPDTTIGRIRRQSHGVWNDVQARISPRASFEGPAWIGAGREIRDGEVVVGPAVLWDEPASRPELEEVQWQEIEPVAMKVEARRTPVRERPLVNRFVKRTFDIVFSFVALVLSLPLWPFIILVILIEDGRPIFFSHRRETLRGAEFGCLKFRSMRKDAESVKVEMAAENLADGPQFFMKVDPRSTRVGRVLRATHLDELPQFLNVLAGHMSVVGPRPSPRKENQYCAHWRDGRLSVRPGITGLWQVRRTRELGRDFQEWIKYDLEYVENGSWRLDLWIIWQTLAILVRGRD